MQMQEASMTFGPHPDLQRTLVEIGGVIEGTNAETVHRKNEECNLRCSLECIPHSFYSGII